MVTRPAVGQACEGADRLAIDKEAGGQATRMGRPPGGDLIKEVFTHVNGFKKICKDNGPPIIYYGHMNCWEKIIM